MTNAHSTMKFCLIGYKPDYDVKDEYEKKTYTITGANGVRNYYTVGIADGDSTEFLITQCFEKFTAVENAVPGGWNGVDLFRELGLCLSGDAKSEYDDLLARDYPNDAERNAAGAFTELKRNLITKLSDHTYPGDRMYTYLMSKVKYMKCKKEDGRYEEPIKVLARLQRLRKMGAMMHHNKGPDFITDDQFTNLFWNIFPMHMHEWLEEDQNMDPFDPANPMDHEDIAGHMQRYWSLHYKKVKSTDSSNKSKRKNDDNDDGGDSGGSNKRRKGNNHRGSGNNDNRGSRGNNGKGGRDNCPIKGHEGHKHDWFGCYLNPKNKLGGFDANAAKEFFDKQANGSNIWYREVYQSHLQDGGRRDNYHGGRGYQGGRGRGGYNGGRGGRGGGGRGYGGGGRGNYQNYHGGNNQGQGGGDGYHYQNQGHDGYHYDNNQHGGQEQQPGIPNNNTGVSYYNLGTAREAPSSSYARQAGFRRI